MIRKIATLYSCFKNGDIELWYCKRNTCDFVKGYRVRGLWAGVRCSDGLLAQWLERHSYKMRVPGSIPG